MSVQKSSLSMRKYTVIAGASGYGSVVTIRRLVPCTSGNFSGAVEMAQMTPSRISSSRLAVGDSSLQQAAKTSDSWTVRANVTDYQPCCAASSRPRSNSSSVGGRAERNAAEYGIVCPGSASSHANHVCEKLLTSV